MMAFAIILVLATSLGIFIKTGNYGEAALALVAGLLTIYSVEWTTGRWLAFVSVWITFTMIALYVR